MIKVAILISFFADVTDLLHIVTDLLHIPSSPPGKLAQLNLTLLVKLKTSST